MATGSRLKERPEDYDPVIRGRLAAAYRRDFFTAHRRGGGFQRQEHHQGTDSAVARQQHSTLWSEASVLGFVLSCRGTSKN
jgi:hypothetical protein